MNNYVLMILIVLALTVLGTATLGFITIKYYWGERGTPPLSAAERKRLREEQVNNGKRKMENKENN